MSTNFREVCLEIYVDGVFHSCDSLWVPQEEDAQLEFKITDAIYDLFGSSAVINAQLEVDSYEDMSVSYSVLDGDAVQVDFDKNDSTSACVERDEQLENEVKNVFSVTVLPTDVAARSRGVDASPETHEKCPTGSNKVWMMKKMSGYFEMLFTVPEPLCVPGIPQPTSETDLVDIAQLSVPVPSVSEQEPQVDLVDPEESIVPGLNRSELEPVSSEGQEVEVRDAISDLKSPTVVCDDLSSSLGPSGNSSGIDQDGMDASPETPEKISPKENTKVRKMKKNRTFFQKLFRIYPAVPEPLCLPDASVPEPEPELDLVDPKESCVPVPNVPEPEPELDLVDPKESCVPVPNVPEPEPELDLVDPKESCVPVPNVPEPEPELDLVDPKESCVPVPSVPEPEPELDLVDSDESCVPGPSVPEMEPELYQVDPKELCVLVPSGPEMEPELDLDDSDESCVPAPSVPEMEPESDLDDSDEWSKCS
ncbi:uncharacterized protein LOC143725684 [Siphateles boraxobius]|uniref:uncharacterized protein LOC143725684 n=1 Tax=Siphateles boraxobius TaxID=180520 RepID=UPI0040631883